MHDFKLLNDTVRQFSISTCEDSVATVF